MGGGGGREGVLGLKVKGRCKRVLGVSNSHFQDFLWASIFWDSFILPGIFLGTDKNGKIHGKNLSWSIQWTLSYKKQLLYISSVLITDQNLNINPATQ